MKKKLYSYLIIYLLLTAHSSGNSNKDNTLFTMPVNFAIMGDSRMLDSSRNNYGGFSNYISAYPDKYPLFANTRFTFSDKDPRTSSNIEGSDYYCSKSCRPINAFKNFPKVLEGGHDGVIFNLGVNNNREVELAIDCFQKMFLSAKQRGWMVIVMTIHPWKGYRTWSTINQSNTELINEWILTKPEGVDLVIDTYSLLEDPERPERMRREFTRDGLHPNVKGHAAIAAELYLRMEEYVSEMNQD